MLANDRKLTVIFSRIRSTFSGVSDRANLRKGLFTSAQLAYYPMPIRKGVCRRIFGKNKVLFLTAAILALAEPALAAPPATAVPTQGATRRTAANRRAEVRVNVQWSGVPLRQAMSGLGRSTKQAILIDRRIDPDQPVELARNGATPVEIVAVVAESLGLAVVHVGPTLYIAPPGAAARIEQQLAQQTTAARRLPTAQSRRWASRAALTWNELAEPHTILGELAAGEEISVRGSELVPHDLWTAAELPPLTLVERLTLLLAPFDLSWSFEEEGRAIKIVPGEAEQAEVPLSR